MQQSHSLASSNTNENTSVSLGKHFTEFVERKVETGRYVSASDVVRAGLRLLEEHKRQVERLRAAMIEGEKSGDPQPFDFDAFLARMHATHEE